MLHHQATGSGAPTLIFVHCFGCALGDWDAQIARLSSRHRCVAVDLPGLGGTPLGADRSMAELARAVDEVREHAAPGPVVLGG